MTPREAAGQYQAKNWSILPMRGKACVEPNWSERTFTIDDIKDGDNIGAHLGSKSNHLTDLDLDCQEAVDVALYFLRGDLYPARPLGAAVK